MAFCWHFVQVNNCQSLYENSISDERTPFTKRRKEKKWKSAILLWRFEVELLTACSQLPGCVVCCMMFCSDSMSPEARQPSEKFNAYRNWLRNWKVGGVCTLTPVLSVPSNFWFDSPKVFFSALMCTIFIYMKMFITQFWCFLCQGIGFNSITGIPVMLHSFTSITGKIKQCFKFLQKFYITKNTCPLVKTDILLTEAVTYTHLLPPTAKSNTFFYNSYSSPMPSLHSRFLLLPTMKRHVMGLCAWCVECDFCIWWHVAWRGVSDEVDQQKYNNQALQREMDQCVNELHNL